VGQASLCPCAAIEGLEMHADPVPAPRQCGRCREMFEGDPTLLPTAIPAWWLCPPCQTALIGDGSAPKAGANGSSRP